MGVARYYIASGSSRPTDRVVTRVDINTGSAVRRRETSSRIGPYVVAINQVVTEGRQINATSAETVDNEAVHATATCADVQSGGICSRTCSVQLDQRSTGISRLSCAVDIYRRSNDRK